jgi:hypothetical protein
MELLERTGQHEPEPEAPQKPATCSRRCACLVVGVIVVALVAGLVLGMRLPSARPRLLWLEELEGESSVGAVCNDGSPAGYYFSPAEASAGVASRRWLIMLQPGFQCYSNASCSCRAAQSPSLVSSRGWSRATLAQGVMHQLRDWNVVSVGYCSSDAWLGDLSGRSSPRVGFPFRGRAILDAAVEQLSERHALRRAERVILGGCSAGARGALYNLDRFCDRLRSSVAIAARTPPRCEGLVDAGWWGANEPTASQRDRGVPSLRAVAEASYALYAPGAHSSKPTGPSDLPSAADESSGVCGACAASEADPSLCLLGASCAAHVRTGFFLAQAQFDAFALGLSVGVAPRAASGTPAAEWEEGGEAESKAKAQRSECEAQWRAALKRGGGGGLTGLFGTTCYAHCLSGSAEWFSATVQGRSAADVFASWLESGSALALDGCADGTARGIGCSGGCPYQPINQSCACALEDDSREGANCLVEPDHLGSAGRADADAEPALGARCCPSSLA